MHLKQMNPETPAKAFTGFGVSQSSAACDLDYITAFAVVQKLQRLYRVSERHAATIAHLAGLGPQEARS